MKKIFVVLIIAFLTLLAAFIAREQLQFALFSFLRVNHPVNAEALVIEGWMSEPMLKEAAEEFLAKKYNYCLVTGNSRTHSPVKVLVSFGVNPLVISTAEAETKRGHNTYHMALAAREWFMNNHPEIKTLNVFTAGPHGRKSWNIFKRTFGRTFLVGVISSTVLPEHPKLGWKNKQGAKNMARYAAGYFYAKIWPFK